MVTEGSSEKTKESVKPHAPENIIQTEALRGPILIDCKGLNQRSNTVDMGQQEKLR